MQRWQRTSPVSAMRIWLFFFALAIPVVPLARAAEHQPLNIESRLELFVDRFLIDRLEGTRLELHRPRPAGVVIRPDTPWEKNARYADPPYGWGRLVIKDADRYVMYYQVVSQINYAESLDGIHWKKPILGLIQVQGNRNNNGIGTTDGVPFFDAATQPAAMAFLDTRPDVPADERYKVIWPNQGHPWNETWAWVSADGKLFRKLQDKPIIRIDNTATRSCFDGGWSIFWSEHEQRYVIYTRRKVFNKQGQEHRGTCRMTSKNFVDWSDPEPMTYGQFGEFPPENIHTDRTRPYFRAPHIYISLAARLMEARGTPTEEQARRMSVVNKYGMRPCETVLMTTRGNNRFDTTFREAFVRPGIKRDDWLWMSNYTMESVVPTSDEEMSLYVHRHVGNPAWYFERMVLRTDGFASINAPFAGGEMVTKPLLFSGRELVINYSTGAAGSVRVEIQNTDGQPVPGFSQEESREIFGDEIERVVQWQSGSDVNKLAGLPVRLRFIMKDADLYSLRFR